MIHPFFQLPFILVTTYKSSNTLLTTLRIHPHASQISSTSSQPFTTPYTLSECCHIPHASSIHGHATPSNNHSPYQCTKLPYSSSCAWTYPTSNACDLPSDATCVTLRYPHHSCDQSYDTASLTPRLTTIDQPCMISQTTPRPVLSTILLPYL